MKNAAAQVSERPMVASHSGAHALSGHYRFKPDEVISAIADTDGYVGVCCVPRFLGGTGDLNTFLDHIEYIVKKFGAERVAIGTDVGYASPNTEAEAAKIPSYPARGARNGGPTGPTRTSPIRSGPSRSSA